jgi:hypothetical protein
MGWLHAYLTADELTKVMAVLDAYAHACPDDDPRTMDERRTDALLELITGEPTNDHPLPDLPPEIHDLFTRQNPEPEQHPDQDSEQDTSAASGRDTSAHSGQDTSAASGHDATQTQKPAETAAETSGTTDATEPSQATASNNETAPAPTITPSRPRRQINIDLRVVIGAGTLLGLDDQPAHLAGYGPIPADMARRLAADSTMRRFLTDPSTGILLAADQQRYRAPAWLHDYVESRDLTCRWPGCRTNARRCDKDHSIPFPQGCTCKENLVCLCRYHHFLKTHGDWTVLLQPDGTYHVTSPTGDTYTTTPPPPGHATPPTRTGKSIYQDPRDDPEFKPPPTKREPYPAEPPF